MKAAMTANQSTARICCIIAAVGDDRMSVQYPLIANAAHPILPFANSGGLIYTDRIIPSESDAILPHPIPSDSIGCHPARPDLRLWT